MLIAYCETCGFRIPESDLTSGAAKKTDENKYFCAKCAANAAPAGQKKPPTKAIARQSLDVARAMSGPESHTPNPNRVSGAVRLPGATGNVPAASSLPSVQRIASPALKPPPAPRQDSSLVMFGGIAGAVGVLLIVFVLM